MKKEIISNKAPQPTGAYSQAVKSNDTLYISSQMPMDPISCTIPSTVSAQVVQILTNIQHILNTASFQLSDIMKVTVYLSDTKHFVEFDKAYRDFLSTPFPARSVIICDLDDSFIELDIIAQK